MTHSLYSEALAFVSQRHACQVDKAGMPYIGHLTRVAERLRDHPVEVQVAGLLHDVVEDTDTPLREVATHFGVRVAEAVDCVTKRKGESTAEYLARVTSNPDAIEVKLADNADNSDEERLALLPVEQSDRLRQKYRDVRAVLLRAREQATPTNH